MTKEWTEKSSLYLEALNKGLKDNLAKLGGNNFLNEVRRDRGGGGPNSVFPFRA